MKTEGFMSNEQRHTQSEMSTEITVFTVSLKLQLQLLQTHSA